MATHVPMARVPFAPLDNPRLQHLASTKNRQNGKINQAPAILGKEGIVKSVLSPKRSYDSAQFDDFDGENIDPERLTSPTKKSKSDALETLSTNGFTFTTPSSRSMPPPPLRSYSSSTPSRTKITSPRTPSTAPAGRSPKRKAAIGRRISAPFSRIDPPASLGSHGNSMLPFSLDAAINGTFSSVNVATKASGSTIQETMPGGWFFDIYEDSPEETAANLMEHSTSILDISSDEDSAKKEINDLGKENMPPEGYDGPTASRSIVDPKVVPSQTEKTKMIRKKILAPEDMDDGQRSPLSDLETEFFIPTGLDKDSYFVTDSLVEKPSARLDPDALFATSAVVDCHKETSLDVVESLPVVNDMGNLKGEIIVWQDAASSTPSITEISTEDGDKVSEVIENEKENVQA